jgi:hypothetical protein
MQMILNKRCKFVESNNGYQKTDKMSVLIFEVMGPQTIKLQLLASSNG